MAETELCFMSLAQVSQLILNKKVSPVEVVEACLGRIESAGGHLNAFITLLAEDALAKARQAETDIGRGRYLGPLHGIPVGLKDIFWTQGVRTTNGSKVFADWVPSEDATTVRLLKSAGAIIIGKTNLHEFACGPTSVNPHFGAVRSPWNLECIAGGSSGGSGAAVAAGLCYMAMGSDTGGSIRNPASACGTVGLKPTYGLVSRYGVTALSWSLDHVGPLTRTVEDTALAMNVLAGYDTQDPASVQVTIPDYTNSLDKQVRGLKVGVIKEYMEEGADAEVRQGVENALDTLRGEGVSVQEVSIPAVKHAFTISFAIVLSEASSYHEKVLRTRAKDLGWDVRSRLEMGQFIPAVAYVKAKRARGVLRREVLRAFEQVNLLASPTVPILAPRIGEETVMFLGKCENVRGPLVHNTRLCNVTGQPAINVPCGFSSNGLPIGLQLAGRPFQEEQVLRVAHAYEQAATWHNRHPIP
jgi:aspartyl-tRNA(Asn)/glutamyl-tRNA(Gln) amidotransferase subunit A